MSDPLPPVDARLSRAYRATTTDAPGPHLGEDDWVRLAADEADAGERATWADHIASCADCAQVYRVVSAVRDGASAFDPGAPARPAPAVVPWSPGRWAGLAAAAVVVLGVAVTLRQSPRSTEAPASLGPAPVAGGGAPAAPAAAPVATPRAWASLPEAPAVTLPASLTLAVRGEGADHQAFLSAFGRAIAPYRAGHYTDAAVALRPLTTTYRDVPEVWFYLGVSALLSDDPAGAEQALAKAAASDAVGAQAVWLRVVALERAGRADEATAALRASCPSATLPAHRAACGALTP